MPQLQIVITNKATAVKTVRPLNGVTTLKAQPGMHYEIQDVATRKPPQKMVFRRKGEDLLVEVDGQQVLQSEGYFSVEPLEQAPSFTSVAADGALVQVDALAMSQLSTSMAGTAFATGNVLGWGNLAMGALAIGAVTGGLTLASNISDGGGGMMRMIRLRIPPQQPRLLWLWCGTPGPQGTGSPVIAP